MEPAPKSAISPAARRAVDLRFVELMDKVRRNRPGDDLELLRRAFDFAAEQHKTQTRLSGEPFLSHPVEVAHLLADMRLDVTALCAALLHDVVEDTKIPLSQIDEMFGADVARLVEGATKISRLDLLAPEARQAENVRKMLLAMVNDVRVVMIKLADRLHNMRTLQFLDSEKQQRISRETLDIYAPVANRLGMGLIRGELEDLAFRYLEPESFLDIQKRISTKQKVFDKFLHEVQDAVRSKMIESGIPAEVQARIKRLYSLHLKIQKQQRTLDQVFDLLALRVITDTVKNCYAALGVIHQIWPPVPGRFKDYIAMPRPNLYQSLHTTVIHAGQPFEVQIRTQEMHRIAEQGVAAHWKYKDGGAVSQADDQRIVWMRQLDRVGAGNGGAQRISLDAPRGSVSRRGLYILAERARRRSAAQRHARRFCVRDSHRSRQSMQRRESEWRAGSAAACAGQWRRGRNSHPKRPRAIARLADLRPHFARPQQNPAMD